MFKVNHQSTSFRNSTKCLLFLLFRRSISSSNVEGICAMLNHAVSIIDSVYREQLYTRLKSGYPSGFDLSQAYTVIQSSIQLGKLQGSDIEKLKQTFLITFNNVEITYGNLHTLKNLLDEELRKTLMSNENNKTKLEVKTKKKILLIKKQILRIVFCCLELFK